MSRDILTRSSAAANHRGRLSNSEPGTPGPAPRRPLSARILAPLAAVERQEVAAVTTAFCLFFCVMSGYFSIRPVRDTVGSMMGRDRLADLWIVVWAVSLAVVPIYGFFVSRFRRSVFLPWTYAFVAASLVFVGISLQEGGPSVPYQLSILGRAFTFDKDVFVGQFFWVFISVLNLFIISVFWSFLLELFRSDQTKRLFGIIAAGGTAGALAGPLFTDFTVETTGNSGVLFIGAGLFTVAIVCQRVLLNIWRVTGTPVAGAVAGGGADPRERPIGGNPLAALSIVARSPYLLGIAMFVVLLATASTFLYFEQLRLVEIAYPEPADRTRVFARLDWIVQSLTIVSQIFLTGRIAARLGLVVLLSMVPIAMIAGFGALAIWNTFPVLAVVFIARRFGEYAFVRPGREMLFGPLDRETKYKAKNLIDVPVYRGADALAAQVQTGVEGAGFGPQTIAVLGVGTAVAWAINGLWVGRRHDRAARGEAATITAPIAARPVTDRA
jgi:AAA family ATP:ADP antiporter